MLNSSFKLIFLIFYSFFIAFKVEISLIYTLPIVISFFILKPPILKILNKVFKLNLFIFLTTITLIVIENSFELAKLIFIRANLIIIFSTIILYKMDGYKIYVGFNNLFLPKKLTMLLFFVIKNIEILTKEVKKLQEVLILKSFNPKLNRFSLKIYGYLFGMLIIKTMQRAERLNDTIALKSPEKVLKPREKLKLKFNEIILILSLIFITLF